MLRKLIIKITVMYIKYIKTQVLYTHFGFDGVSVYLHEKYVKRSKQAKKPVKQKRTDDKSIKSKILLTSCCSCFCPLFIHLDKRLLDNFAHIQILRSFNEPRKFSIPAKDYPKAKLR